MGRDMLRGVTEVVRSRQFGRVAVVELHRPQVRHAMNTDLLDALIAALRNAARAAGTDAVVVTRASNWAFVRSRWQPPITPVHQLSAGTSQRP